MLRSVVDVSTNVSITLTNEDTKTRNCSLICDFQGDREKNDNAKDGRSVRVIESDDAKDGRSVRPDQRKMNHADRKYVLIGLQALQPTWNMFVVAWILLEDRKKNDAAKDGRSVREVESRMNYAIIEHVLIGLQALQPT